MFTNGDCVRGRPFGSRSCSKVNAELQRHGRRLWNKVQAIFLGTMKDLANLEREVFDIRRVSTGIRIAVNSAPAGFPVALAPLASITIGRNSVVNEDRFQSLAPTVDFHMLQTYLEDMSRRKARTQAAEQSGSWLFCTINLIRENGDWCWEWVDDLRHKNSVFCMTFLAFMPC